MKLYYLAFSSRGLALAQKLASALGGQAERCGGPSPWPVDGRPLCPGDGSCIWWGPAASRCGRWRPICAARRRTLPWWLWTSRGILRCLWWRDTWGGANALARAIAAACGAVPCAHHRHRCGGTVPHRRLGQGPGLCRGGSPQDQGRVGPAAGRAGHPPLQRLAHPGPAPAGSRLTGRKEDCDAALTLTDPGSPLWLVPRVLALGVGCRRGTPGPDHRGGLAGPCGRPGPVPQKRVRGVQHRPQGPMSRGCWNSAAAMAGPWLPIPPPSCGTRRAALPPPRLL